MGQLLRYPRSIATGHHQRLRGVLPRLLYSLGLPCFLHRVCHLLYPLHRPQDLVPDALDSPGGRHRYLLRQRRD